MEEIQLGFGLNKSIFFLARHYFTMACNSFLFTTKTKINQQQQKTSNETRISLNIRKGDATGINNG